MLNNEHFRRHSEASKECVQALDHYLAASSASAAKLQLGAGSNVLNGWFNTDLEPQYPEIYVLDVTKPFQIPSKTFDYIFSEHHIEHVTFSKGNFMLRECFRILKPGGVIRLATPDLAVILGLYTNDLNESQKNYIRFISDAFITGMKTRNPVFVINNAFRNWDHQFLYDKELLKHCLETTGFTKVVQVAPKHSAHTALNNLEMHGDFIGSEDINSFESMIIEGTKPFM